MKIVTLTTKNEAPLLPPGVVANRSDQVEKLIGDFNSWLASRNHALAVMAPNQIYDTLFQLLGGSRTPENSGQIPRFHGILNDAYHRVVATLGGQPQGHCAPLLPPELNYKN